MVSFKGHDQQKVNMLNDNRRAPRQLLYYQNDRQVQYEQIAPRKKEASKGMKTLYTILAVIGAVALGFLVAAASCSLSCNGMQGLAALVGIGGGVLIVVLAILVIKSIWNPRRVKRIKTSKDTNPIPQKSAIQV
jgi:protein-S-isoprenylcysteine O-methyltransferase Ste14